MAIFRYCIIVLQTVVRLHSDNTWGRHKYTYFDYELVAFGFCAESDENVL